MSFRIKRFIARLFAVATLFGAYGAGAQPLTIGFSTTDVSNLLVYIAKDRKMFEAEGLQTNFITFQNDNAAAQALMAGAVQVNCASIFPVFESHAVGRDFTAIWGLSNLPGYNWYSLPAFKSLDDLKGKGVVGVSAIGAMSHQLSAWALTQVGVDPAKDIRFLALGGPMERVAALKAGQVSLIPATPPGTFILEAEGYKPLIELKSIAPEFTYETYYTRRSTIKRDEVALRKMLAATIKAKRWAVDNRAEATKILMANMGAPDDQVDIYRKSVDFALEYSPESGEFPPKSVDVLIGFYTEKGRFKSAPEHSVLIDRTFIDYFKTNPVK